MGLCLKEYAPKSKLRAAVHELAEKIAEPERSEESSGGSKGSLFSRLLNAV
jgi:hypothetical protein